MNNCHILTFLCLTKSPIPRPTGSIRNGGQITMKLYLGLKPLVLSHPLSERSALPLTTVRVPCLIWNLWFWTICYHWWCQHWWLLHPFINPQWRKQSNLSICFHTKFDILHRVCFYNLTVFHYDLRVRCTGDFVHVHVVRVLHCRRWFTTRRYVCRSGRSAPDSCRTAPSPTTSPSTLTISKWSFIWFTTCGRSLSRYLIFFVLYFRSIIFNHNFSLILVKNHNFSWLIRLVLTRDTALKCHTVSVQFFNTKRSTKSI